jgi:hypothetical protein
MEILTSSELPLAAGLPVVDALAKLLAGKSLLRNFADAVIHVERHSGQKPEAQTS